MLTNYKIMRKYLYVIIFLLLAYSCEKEISEKQTEYFLKIYGTYLENYASSVRPSMDNGYVIVGTSETEENGTDITFIRTDRFGRQVGEIKYYGMSGNDYGLCVDQIENGYIIGGSVMDNGVKKAFLLETDQEGNQVGEMIIYGPGEYRSVRKRDDNTYLAVGSAGNTFLITNYNPDTKTFRESFTGADNTMLYSIGFTPEGKTLSSGSEGNQLNMVHIDQSGNYFATEKFGNPLAQNTFASFIVISESNSLLLSNISASGIDFDVSLVKIQSSYNGPVSLESDEVVDSTGISGSGSYEGNAIIRMDNGNLAVLVTRTFAGDKNMLLYIMDEDLNLTAEPKEFGGTGDQEGVDLLYDNDHILILGTNSYEGNTMITLIKTDSQGNIWK